MQEQAKQSIGCEHVPHAFIMTAQLNQNLTKATQRSTDASLGFFLPSSPLSLLSFSNCYYFFFSFVHLFVCLFYVYGCFSCMYVHVSHACLVSLRGQKKGSEALGLERDTGCFVPPCSSCESSLGPVERQPVFLTA